MPIKNIASFYPLNLGSIMILCGLGGSLCHENNENQQSWNNLPNFSAFQPPVNTQFGTKTFAVIAIGRYKLFPLLLREFLRSKNV